MLDVPVLHGDPAIAAIYPHHQMTNQNRSISMARGVSFKREWRAEASFTLGVWLVPRVYRHRTLGACEMGKELPCTLTGEAEKVWVYERCWNSESPTTASFFGDRVVAKIN